MKKTGPLFVALAIMTGSGCVMPRDIVILEDRIIVLEQQSQLLRQQNQELQNQVREQLQNYTQTNESSEQKIRSQYANMNAGVDMLQSDVRSLTGRIEEIDYAMNRKLAAVESSSARLDEINQQAAALNQRVAQIENYLNLEKQSKPAAPPAVRGAPSEQTSDPSSDKQLYDNAKQAYDNGQLDKAREGFEQLLKSYPRSSHADNAQFWIGESYFREKWYEKAILEYQTVIEKYPNGNKVAAAMLKQAMAFLNLGDKSNARLIFKELEKRFPKTNEARIAEQKLKEL